MSKITAHVISMSRVTLGTYSYDFCPRAGDWITLSDNDGSGDDLWLVELVIHFWNGGIALHVSPINRWDGFEKLEKRIIDRDQKKLIVTKRS
jgi:hypothetical protein